jgi:hypothetical protein
MKGERMEKFEINVRGTEYSAYFTDISDYGFVKKSKCPGCGAKRVIMP